MTKFMLDTNICIYLMRHQPESVAKRFSSCQVGDVVMSAITYAELQFGVLMAESALRERENLASLVEDIPVACFDPKAAQAYGFVRFATKEIKKDQLDKLIAAHALSLGLTLVSNNERDFEKYPNLTMENWLNE